MKKLIFVIGILFCALGSAQTMPSSIPLGTQNDSILVWKNNRRIGYVPLTTLSGWISDAIQGGAGDNQALSLSGNVLSISNGNSVDLTPILGGGGSQTIETFSFNTSTNILTLQLSGDTVQTVDLSTLDGGSGGTDDQQISLSGNILTLENGGTVDLSGYLDNTDSQTLSVSGSQLTISGGNTVNLPGGGGSGDNNLNEVLITSQADLSNASNANKVGCLQNNITLTGNVTLAQGLKIKNCGGYIILNGFELIGNLSKTDNNEDLVVIDASTGTISGTWKNTGNVYAKSFGVKDDGVIIKDAASITSGSTTLTVTGANFTSDDVGKLIAVKEAVTGFNASDPQRSQNSLQTTIASVTSSTVVELTDAATRTATNTDVIYFTDNFTAGKNFLNVVNSNDSTNPVFGEGLTVTRVFQYGQGSQAETKLSNDVVGWVVGEGTDYHKVIIRGTLMAAPHNLRQSRLISFRNTHYYKLTGRIEQDLEFHNYSGLPAADEGDDQNIGIFVGTACYNGTIDDLYGSNVAGTFLTTAGDLQFTNYIKGSSSPNFGQAESEMAHGYIDEVTGEPVYDSNSKFSITTDSLDISKSQFETTRLARSGRTGRRHYQFSGSSLAGWSGLKTPRYWAFYYDEFGNLLYKSGEQQFYHTYQYEDNVFRVHLMVERVDDLTTVDAQVRANLNPMGLTLNNVNIDAAGAHGLSNMPTNFVMNFGSIKNVGNVLPAFSANAEDMRRAAQNQIFNYVTFEDGYTGYLNWVGTEMVRVNDCYFLGTTSYDRIRTATGNTTSLSANDGRNFISSNNQFYNASNQYSRSAYSKGDQFRGGNLQIGANNVRLDDGRYHNVTIANISVATEDRQPSIIKGAEFTYDKPWEETINLITDPNYHIIYDDVEFRFNDKARTTYLNDKDATYEVIEFGGTEGLRLFNNSPVQTVDYGGYFRNIRMTGARIARSIRDYASTYTYFPITDIKGDNNYIGFSINFKNGLPKDRVFENLKVDGWVQIDANQFSNTDVVGEPTLTFTNLKQTIPLGEFDWTNTGSYIFDTAARDFNLEIIGGYSDLQVTSNETGTYKKYIRFQHLGTTLIKDFTFKSASAKTIDFNDFPVTLGAITIQDCTCENITFIGRPGDVIDCDGVDGGTGTVTSVGITSTDGAFTISNSPITSSGNIGITTDAATLRTVLNVEDGAAADQNAAEVSVAATPTNYTAGSANVEAHLSGIDAALATAGGGFDPTQDITLDDGTNTSPTFNLENSNDTRVRLYGLNTIGYLEIDSRIDNTSRQLRIQSSSVVPTVTATSDFGQTGLRWRNGWFSTKVTAAEFEVEGGTGLGFLKDNGDIDTNTYLTLPASILYNVDRTFAIGEANDIVYTSSGNRTYTIPTNANVAFPVGTKIELINTSNTNSPKLGKQTGVNVTRAWNVARDSTLYAAGEKFLLEKTATDTWQIDRIYRDQDYSGWGSYTDTQYTSGSPFVITGNDTYVNLPNNAGSTLEIQLPVDIAELYDGTVIPGREGDGINITISFAVRPTTAQTTRVTIVPDIGGAVGEIEDYARDTSFSKGSGIVQRYLSSFNAYTLDTWELNGATMKIKADQNCEIFGIRYFITTTHRAR